MAINPIKFWCQKILPLVYDDSLSYYELLCKVTAKLNELIEYSTIYPEYVKEYVDEWLSEHPEATTTIQDHSIDHEKLIIGTLGYVTPQMYGAKGDGITDDTESIEKAIASPFYVYFPIGSYKITDTITISKNKWKLDASNANIIYTGGGSAFLITNSQNIELRLGSITATNGDCIRLYSENTRDYVQYIDIYFKEFRALTNCVLGTQAHTGWVNEIRFYNGRVTSGTYGFHMLKAVTSTDTMNHWNFYNIGIEGVTNGYYFENLSNTRISDISFFGNRYNESFVKLIISVGLCQFFTFVGSGMLTPDVLTISSKSDLWRFICPSLSQHYMLIVQRGKIVTCGYSVVTDGGIAIEDNEDLNNYTYPCNAYCSSGARSATLLHCPVTSAFRLVVYTSAGLYYENSEYNYLIQEIMPINSDVYYRRRVSRGGSLDWVCGDWQRYVYESPLSDYQEITFGTATFKYKYNNKLVEWKIDTGSGRFNELTTLGTIPYELRPSESIIEPLSFLSNAEVTSSGRNIIRITNNGNIDVIAPNNYQNGHGVYYL